MAFNEKENIFSCNIMAFTVFQWLVWREIFIRGEAALSCCDLFTDTLFVPTCPSAAGLTNKTTEHKKVKIIVFKSFFVSSKGISFLVICPHAHYIVEEI